MQMTNAMRSQQHNSDGIWSNGMVNASLRGISVSEAECVLANIWHRVEEYGADAPRMQFDFRRDGSINIQLSFTDPVIAALVLNGLTTGTDSRDQRKAASIHAPDPMAPPS